jgi:hypothetical protein
MRCMITANRRASATLRIDLYRAGMLLDDNVMAEGKAEARSLAGGFGLVGGRNRDVKPSRAASWPQKTRPRMPGALSQL